MSFNKKRPLYVASGREEGPLDDCITSAIVVFWVKLADVGAEVSPSTCQPRRLHDSLVLSAERQISCRMEETDPVQLRIKKAGRGVVRRRSGASHLIALFKRREPTERASEEIARSVRL